MGRVLDFRGGTRWLFLVTAVASLVVYVACDTPSTPEYVEGPAVTGNQIPVLTITEPDGNLSIGQGATFHISWTDQDRDSAALISFSLINTDTEASPASVSLVEGIPENDTAASDTVTVSTGFVPRGSYYLQGTISDSMNTPVTTFATTGSPGNTRIIITVGEEGTVPGNQPPTIVVIEPLFNLSVTLDDTIEIYVQPTIETPHPILPYDPDDETSLYISLDLDDDPQTGDPLNPDPDELILLLDSPITIPASSYEALDPIRISVDLSRFPLREDGKSYYVRATIDDRNNAPRNAYATGAINVTRVATGVVDLGLIGGTLTGARWLGFDPGARLGTSMTTIADFDDDGVEDCVLVSQFGVPTGRPGVGEGYLIYGLVNRRFGGRINVNTVGTNIEGVTFIGPVPSVTGSGETNGITSASFIPDLSGDQRPELLFGCSYVDGVWQGRDDDPSDTDVGDREEFLVEVQQRRLTVTDTRTGEVVLGPDFTYESVLDTYLDSASASTAFGDEDYLRVDATEIEGTVTPSQWALIKYDNLRSYIPDFAYGMWEDNSVQGKIEEATLTFYASDRGSQPSVNPLLQDFIAGSTYANWPMNGADPEEGVDYDDDALSWASGGDLIVTGWNSVEVTKTFEELFEGARDIIGWIMVAKGADDVVFSSSDTAYQELRPKLTIRYTRRREEGANLDNCYPDFYPNNTSNPFFGGRDDIIAGELNYEKLGMAALIYSENRDSQPDGNAELNSWRWRRAKAIIAYAGQESASDGGSNIRPFSVNPASGRLDGARFQVAMYDSIDAQNLNQPPIRAELGTRVGFLPDINNDQIPEVIISAPKNEQDIEDLITQYPQLSEYDIPHLVSRPLRGNIQVFHGRNFDVLRETSDGNASFPHFHPDFPGSCNPPIRSRSLHGCPYDTFVIFGEKPSDELGDGSSAGDFNLDGSPDILCGAWLADGPTGTNVGATYIVYSRQSNEDEEVDLANGNFPSLRSPMLRIRGDRPEDRIGWAQESVLDINGDRIDDVVLTSPFADAGGVPSDGCSRDFNGNGALDSEDKAAFSSCRAQFGDADLSTDNSCAFFDYNNDRRIDALDSTVFSGGDCPVDNGVIAVVFGGIFLDGDRVVNQIATTDLPGVVFFGNNAGDRAGFDIASAGDFNRDGYGDLLITAPGATATDEDGRVRVGVTYLVFGGTHLSNKRFNLADVGTTDLPGFVFLSPYEEGAPDEAPPQYVAGLGDINHDGFDDIAIGNPLADFVDDLLPQTPGSPGSDLSTGRRREAGEVYMIYGHNTTESSP